VDALIEGRCGNAFADSYPSEREFLADLTLMRDSLVSHGDHAAATASCRT